MFVAALVALVLSALHVQCLEKKYFYIYEWPPELGDVWPRIGAQLYAKSPYSHRFRGSSFSPDRADPSMIGHRPNENMSHSEYCEEGGEGELLDADIGMYMTWQFSLYQNVMARLRTSELRTRLENACC